MFLSELFGHELLEFCRADFSGKAECFELFGERLLLGSELFIQYFQLCKPLCR